MPTREELLKRGAKLVTPQGGASISGTLTREQLLQRGATAVGQPQAAPVEPTADEIAAQETGASFPSQAGGTAAGQLARTVGNIPSSIFGVAKGALSLINPLQIARNIQEVATGAPELVREAGGVGEAVAATAKALPGAAAQLLPRSVTEAAKAIGSVAKGDQEGFDTALQNLERELVNNPAELPLELLTGGRGVAAKLGKVDQFDAVVSRAAKPIAQPIQKAGEAIATGTSRVTRGAVAQATGLQPTTISQVLETPEQFTKQKQSAFSRQAVGEKVQVDFNKRLFELSDTGAAYKGFRQSKQVIEVTPDFVEKIIRSTTKSEIVDGKVKPSGKSIIREAKDIRAIQSLLDFWKETFEKGRLDADEFLNFRNDLGKMSKFERDIGKSGALEAVGRRMRRTLNQRFRQKFTGLKELDSKFEPQARDVERLGKDLFDREGNLKPASIDKIANLTTGTVRKTELLSRIEEISPGSAEQIRILRAIEDIERAAGIKVGTYGKAALIGGGLATSGIVGAVVAAVLTSPEFAVPIIRRFGILKNRRIVREVNSTLAKEVKNPKEEPRRETVTAEPIQRAPEQIAPRPEPTRIGAGQQVPLLAEGQRQLPEGKTILPEAGELQRESGIRESQARLATEEVGQKRIKRNISRRKSGTVFGKPKK